MALLRELEAGCRWHDGQQAVIVTAEITGSAGRWVSAQLDELGQATGHGC